MKVFHSNFSKFLNLTHYNLFLSCTTNSTNKLAESVLDNKNCTSMALFPPKLTFPGWLWMTLMRVTLRSGKWSNLNYIILFNLHICLHVFMEMHLCLSDLLTLCLTLFPSPFHCACVCVHIFNKVLLFKNE